jgi:hypothetical protein
MVATSGDSLLQLFGGRHSSKRQFSPQFVTNRAWSAGDSSVSE